MVDGELLPMPEAMSADTVVWFALPLKRARTSTGKG